MSHIPIFSYRSYLDDIIRLKDQGHADVDTQVARPNSAGSRGLRSIKDFMKEPVHMMGESENSKKICPPATQDITLNLDEIKKGQKDSNGYTKCWTGYHAQGTKKSNTTGKTVRNCVPNESVTEANNPAQQAAIASAMKKK